MFALFVLILSSTAAMRQSPPPSLLPPAVFYVSPDGGPSGDGSAERPLDLVTALSNRTLARAGDLLILRGGTYRGQLTSTLTGLENKPITLTHSPGERARIDGSLTVQGAWAVYRDFEVMNSGQDRTKERPTGVNIFGPHTKFINLIVHDAGNGMAFWSPAVDGEIYGCIIYRNGWQGPDPARGSGHAIYSQNETGTKRIVDNILFNQFGWGIHAYTQEGSLSGFHFEGNVAFNNGSATRQGYRYDNILVGGYRPAERITLISNYTYHTPGKGGKNRLGYTSANKDATVKDNYFAGGNPVLGLLGWEKATITGNTLYGSQNLLGIVGPKGMAELPYEVDNNTYLEGEVAAPFVFQNKNFDFAGWQQATGFDKHSRWIPSPTKRPSGVKVFIRPNQYEPGRAHIIVFNWDLSDTVAA
ncbi:MAG: right-handed parallel beta-helix repeat-containing protein, partial [Acidobacteria bacterium]|nr:right-handed parallel beta-helix repeat-containing protein [Acidobacteriota bacterium]